MSLDPARRRRPPGGAPGASPTPADVPVVVACSGGADSLALLAATVHETRRTGAARRRRRGRPRPAGGLAPSTPPRVVAQMAALGADRDGLGAGCSVEADGPGPGGRRPRGALRGPRGDRGAPRRRRRCCSATPSTTRPRPCCSAWPAARAVARSRGCARGFGIFRRPLLAVRRAETEAACRAEGIEWWQDPHNADPRFTRSRVRHTVLPLLEQRARARGRGDPGPHRRAAAPRHGGARRVRRAGPGRAPGTRPPASPSTTSPPSSRPPCAPGAAPGRRCAPAARPAELFAVHVDALEAQVHNRTHLPRRVQLPGHVTALRAGDRALLRPDRCGRLRAWTQPTCRRPGRRALHRGADPGAARRAGRARSRRDYEGQDLLIVGILRGAVMVMADLARSFAAPHRDGLDGGVLLRLGHQVQRRRAHPQGPRHRHLRAPRGHRRRDHRHRPDAVAG